MLTQTVNIWILAVPPEDLVETIDLSHYHFRKGESYEVGPYLAALLIDESYAAPDRRARQKAGESDSDRAADATRHRD